MTWYGFNFGDIYSEMVKRFDHAVFIEIGSCEGESAVFMAKEIKSSGKDIKFYTVDIFQPYERRGVIFQADYETYLKNIEPYKDFINTIVGDSIKISEQFANGSIDFVFIDGDHRYEYVKKDILAWLPKLKPEGVMAGHDYTWPYPGVIKAVDEIFPNREIRHESWIR